MNVALGFDETQYGECSIRGCGETWVLVFVVSFFFFFRSRLYTRGRASPPPADREYPWSRAGPGEVHAPGATRAGPVANRIGPRGRPAGDWAVSPVYRPGRGGSEEEPSPTCIRWETEFRIPRRTPVDGVTVEGVAPRAFIQPPPMLGAPSRLREGNLLSLPPPPYRGRWPWILRETPGHGRRLREKALWR